MRRLLALALASLAGCAVGHAQTDDRAATRCRVDADCVVASAMPECGPCGTCPGAPIALSSQWVDTQVRACAAQRRREDARYRAIERRGGPARPPPPHCSPCPAPPAGSARRVTAACRARVCRLVEEDAGQAAPPSIDDLLGAPTS